MSINIDLATFNINTDRLFQSLVDTRKEIERLRLANRDLQNQMTASNRNVADAQREYNRLNSQLENLTQGTDEYNTTVTQLTTAENRLNTALTENNQLQQTYQQTLTQNTLELNQLNNQARNYTTVLDAQNRQTNESIDLYTRQRAELTLLQREQRELGAQLIELERNGQRNTQEYRDLSNAYEQASEGANQLATSLRNVDQSGGNFQTTIGNYRSAFEDFKGSLLSGDIKGAISGLKEGLTGLFNTLIANPILGVVAGLIAGTKAIFDFNQGIQESNQLLKGLGVASADISRVRSELEATAETFGKSFEEIAKTADSLSASYGISISEANDIIAKGLVQGGRANEDFLNQISEYDVQFKALGVSAEQSLSIISTGFSEGVYADKLPDALKELQLSLTEGTKSSRDALKNAFGSGFTNELLAGVQSGSLSVVDALNKIGIKSKELGLNLQQQQQITADVFRGAGEDAGGALKIIDLISKSQVRGLTESEQAVEDLRLANERLNKEQAKLFEIENFGSVWAKIQTFAINFFASTLEYVGRFKTAMQPILDIVGVLLVNSFEILKTQVTAVFDFVIGIFENFGIVIKTVIDAVKKIFRGDFRGAIDSIKDGFFSLLENVELIFGRLKNTIIDGIKAIVKNIAPLLDALGIDVDKLQKKLDGFKNQKVIEIDAKKKSEEDAKIAEAEAKAKLEAQKKQDEEANKLRVERNKKDAEANKKALADAQKAKEDALKKIEELNKKEIELLKTLGDEKSKLAQQELDRYILFNGSKLENEKFLTKALIEEEKQRLYKINAEKQAVSKAEFDAKKKAIEDEIKAEELKQSKLSGKALTNSQLLVETKKNEIKLLEGAYFNEEVRLNQETDKQVAETDKKYTDQQNEYRKQAQAIAFQQKLIDLESQGATEYEIQTAKLENEKQLELQKLGETLAEKFQLKLDTDANNQITQDEVDKGIKDLQNAIALEEDEGKKQALQTQLDALTQIKVGYANKELAIENQVNQNKIKGRTQVLQGIAQLFGTESDMGKAVAIAGIIYEKFNAVSSIISNTAKANASAVAASPLTAGMPWVGINTAKSAIDIGLAVATGAQSIAGITGAKFAPNLGGLTTTLQGVQTLSGFSEGGYTGSGGKYEPAGIVHRGEVVFSQADVAQLGGARIVDAMRPTSGYANGGIVGLPSVQSLITNGTNNNSELIAETIGQKVLEGAMAGTEMGSNSGIGNYNDNIQVKQSANF